MTTSSTISVLISMVGFSPDIVAEKRMLLIKVWVWTIKAIYERFVIFTLQYERYHDDVIKWKHFLRYWPFVRWIHRPPVNSPHKGQWRGALMFSLICVWINGWVNNREAVDLRRYRAHYDVNVMMIIIPVSIFPRKYLLDLVWLL